jgi:hypothetical protein
MGEGTIDERAFITGHLLLEALQRWDRRSRQRLVSASSEIRTSWVPLSIHWLYCSKEAITTLTIEGSNVGHHATRCEEVNYN